MDYYVGNSDYKSYSTMTASSGGACNLRDDGRKAGESERYIRIGTCLSGCGVISVVELILLTLHS